MHDKKYCVYRHTSPNGKVYIGVTSLAPERRWERGHGYRYNAHFWNAIVKYGWDNFLHEIVCDGLTREQAYSLEKELISIQRSNDPRRGYNITDGGCGGLRGVQISEETRRKKSESAKRSWEKPERRALVRSGYHLAVSSPDRAALYSDPQRRAAASETQKAVWADPAKRQRIIDGMHAGGQKKRRTPVVQRTLDGEFIRTWVSMCEIEKKLGIPTGKISECCNGKRSSYKGYCWTFLEVGQ